MGEITGICSECDNPTFQVSEQECSDPETGWQYILHNMRCGNCGHEYESYDSIVTPIVSSTVPAIGKD